MPISPRVGEHPPPAFPNCHPALTSGGGQGDRNAARDRRDGGVYAPEYRGARLAVCEVCSGVDEPMQNSNIREATCDAPACRTRPDHPVRRQLVIDDAALLQDPTEPVAGRVKVISPIVRQFSPRHLSRHLTAWPSPPRPPVTRLVEPGRIAAPAAAAARSCVMTCFPACLDCAM
jgi:hypothetical protein